MANLTYRQAIQQAPAGTTTKNASLTSQEIDGNFKSLNDELIAKAPLVSPGFSGVPTAPTATAGTNTTQLATTAFVQTGLSDRQPLDATLTALSGVSTAANQLIYSTASDTFSTTGITSFGRSIIDDVDAPAARTTLGLGTAAVQSDDRYAHRSNNLSDLANMAMARSNLGLSNSATIAATNLNTGNTIVQRDASGNFSAGTITASLSGNATTANALTTARTISLIGDVTGSVSFNGSANANITATVVDDSHNHVISNVDGLQTALDMRVPLDSSTGAATIPSGSTAQRPTGTIGDFRFNTSLNRWEGYGQSGWDLVGGSTSFGVVDRISVKDFGAAGDGVTDDTAAIEAAIAAATTAKTTLVFPSGTYKLVTPSNINGLQVDLGVMSIVANGNVKIDCTSLTTNYAIHVFSSLSYPESHYQNTTHGLRGLIFIGGATPGVRGMLAYHPTYTNGCQFKIDSCSFYNFDTNLYFESNTWRVSFVNCSFLTGHATNILFGAGTNQGESVMFNHCLIADGGDFQVNSMGSQINLYSTSILNTRLWVTGNANTINIYGGNIENPGSALAYQYIRIGNLAGNNHANTVNLFGVPITVNPTSWTDPLFYVLTNNSLNFVNITWPDISDYNVAGTTGYFQYVDGGGKVSASGSSYWPLGGGEKPIVSKQVNRAYNGDFETGNTNGWTISAYGTPGATAVASATAKKDGSYGLLVTTVVDGGVNATQSFPVRPGELVKICCWAKVATLATTQAGFFSIEFLSADGQVLAPYGDAISAADWTQRGNGLSYYAPIGVASVRLVLNGQPGGNVLYIDNVAINIV